MDTYFCTDRGKIRERNEDAVYCNAEEGIFIVADGMGGHAGGEIASQIAIDVLSQQLIENPSIDDGILTEGFALANQEIFETAAEKGYSLMGTTASLLFLPTGDPMAKIGHVGDSRIYRVRDRDLTRLTKDHSYVEELVDAGKITREEAFSHPNRNIITRALGTHHSVKTDLLQVSAQEGDIFLLCSDGLSGKLQHEEIQSVLLEAQTLNWKGNHLLEMALNRGGEDNISLILIEITGTEVDA